MADLLFIVITIAFFALAAGFVQLCDRIIGPDPEPTADPPAGAADSVEEAVA